MKQSYDALQHSRIHPRRRPLPVRLLVHDAFVSFQVQVIDARRPHGDERKVFARDVVIQSRIRLVDVVRIALSALHARPRPARRGP